MRQFPDDFDDGDKAFASELVPDGVLVTGLISVVSWMDADGDFSWLCYNATGEGPRSAEAVGLLELAKLHLIAHADTGLPFSFAEDDDE